MAGRKNVDFNAGLQQPGQFRDDYDRDPNPDELEDLDSGRYETRKFSTSQEEDPDVPNLDRAGEKEEEEGTPPSRRSHATRTTSKADVRSKNPWSAQSQVGVKRDRQQGPENNVRTG